MAVIPGLSLETIRISFSPKGRSCLGAEEELAQWLRAPIALADDCSLIPSAHVAVHSVYLQLQGSNTAFWFPRTLHALVT